MDIPVHPDQQARIDQFLETQKEGVVEILAVTAPVD